MYDFVYMKISLVTNKEPVVNLELRKFFWQVLRPQRKWLLAAILLVIVSSGLGAATSYFFKLIIDAVEAGDTNAAMFYGLMYPVVVFVVQILYRAGGVAGGNLIVRLAKTTTDTLQAHLMQHNHTYYSDRFAGSVINKVRNVVGALDQIVPDFLWNQLDTLVSFLVTFALLWLVDPYIATLFLCLVAALLVANKFLAAEKARLSKANAEAGTKLQGRSVDVVGNMSAVRQYVRQDYELAELASLSMVKQKTGLASWLYTEKLLLVNAVIIFIFALSMFWLLVTKWSQGSISAGDFVLVVALISQITGTLLFIGRAVNATARAMGELREGLSDIYVPYTIEDMPQALPLALDRGEINWQSVAFTYENNAVFSDLSLLIPGQQRIGLVGSSGAGKSTFVSLLLRQHELSSGVITIDGQDISQVTQDSLRQAIAIVPQDPALFHRSIKDNIAYGNQTATQGEIEEAARSAYAHEFICQLPQGYDTTVGERGVKLSGGQKQRIAIARAMLKNAPILILDEATSALDSESEQLIKQALHTLMQGKTVIAIAHRLSTLKEMDRIIVLNNGIIVEDGTHMTLKDTSGIYARLWSHQADGFLAD
jgi:ATP-binding cassette, subfamily B, bacterial